MKILVMTAFLTLSLYGCTQETQNKFFRGVQNWTGTNGVLDVIDEGKVMYRFIHIDKLSTATGTTDKEIRPYRFGYGVMDTDFDFNQGPNEKKTYFEISDYSTSYVFYENPNEKT